MLDFFNTVTTHKTDIVAVVGGLSMIASALANIWPKSAFLGKLVHLLAINFNVK